MAQLKLFPKRIHHKTNHRTSTIHSLRIKNPILPKYSTVITNPSDYPVDNTSVKNDNDRPVKIYSKTNYPFLPPSFSNPNHSASNFRAEHLTAT